MQVEDPQSLIIVDQVLSPLSDAVDFFLNIPLPVDTVNDPGQVLLELGVEQVEDLPDCVAIRLGKILDSELYFPHFDGISQHVNAYSLDYLLLLVQMLPPHDILLQLVVELLYILNILWRLLEGVRYVLDVHQVVVTQYVLQEEERTMVYLQAQLFQEVYDFVHCVQ